MMSGPPEGPPETQPLTTSPPPMQAPDGYGASSPTPGLLEADRALLAQPARQAIIAVVFIALRLIRGLGAVQIGVFIVFLVSGRVPGGLLVVGIGAVCVGAAFMVASWWRFTFVVIGDELVVNKGILAQERLTIPLDRVQSVSINQSFLHRFIGVVSASVDTAGSSSVEFKIDAIDRNRAEALQRMVAGHQRRIDPEAQGVGVDGAAGEPRAVVEDQLIVSRTPMELVRIGITRWPWAGLVALAPLLAMFDDLLDVLPFDLEDGAELLPGELPTEVGSALAVVVLTIALVVLVIGALFGTALQVAQEVVSNWDLKLLRTETGLRRTAGLFNKTSKASTLNRIQSVQTDQTPAQRLFGLRKLTLPTIGDGDIEVPGASEDELATVRNLVFGSATTGTGVTAAVTPPADDRMVSRLMVFRSVRNTTIGTLVLLAVLAATVGWWSVGVLVLIPNQWLTARRKWRLRRWSLSPLRIAESYAFVNKHTAEIELIKAQTVSVKRSFYERRRGLATVRIGTAEGYLAVPMITLEEANAVRDRALFAAESDRRSWM